MTRLLAVLGAIFCLGMIFSVVATEQLRGDIELRLLIVHGVLEFISGMSLLFYCGFAALHSVSRVEAPFDRMMWILLTVVLNVLGSLFYYLTKYQDFRRHGLGGLPHPKKDNGHLFYRATTSELQAERDEYHVLDWPDKPEMLMRHLLRTFPEIVVDRYLVNTSFDSGYLKLTDTEIADGWFMNGRFAHSPKISKPDQIPRDQFDEWLVFEDAVEISRFETLVNYCNFTPIDFAWEEKLDEFWSQIEKYRPLHIIGENDRLYFVSREAELVERIREAEPGAAGQSATRSESK